MKKDMNIKAVFIGDKSENGSTFIRLSNKLTQEHLGWRQNFNPQDIPAISVEDQSAKDFIETEKHMEEVLCELSMRMRSGAVPWHSPRYLGHMNSETLMPAILAYNFAELWNSNNVALESSMATSQMEVEVGQDFARLFGYKNGWGHIAADGTIANIECLWYARCIKSFPLAVKELFPDKVKGMDEWQLLNMSVEDVLKLMDSFTPDEGDLVKRHSSRSGKFIEKLGVVLVPQTKHYSWQKAVDICGVGLDRLREIPVKSNYTMDVKKLEETIREFTDKKIPIMQVVAVVGTTEEGQVDDVTEIVKLRERLGKEGIYFQLHVDAAFGGYGRTIFIDENDRFVEYDELEELLKKHRVFNYPVKITRQVYEGYKGIPNAETITIDPHKMGYVPYSAGGVVIKHRNMRNFISYFAPYVFEKSTISAPNLLGSFMLEGSKAGATAAAVWAAHQTLPLNVTGYGRLIGATIEAAQRYEKFLSEFRYETNGKVVICKPLIYPNFNMVDWVFMEEGCKDLARINRLNDRMYQLSTYTSINEYLNTFITSHTAFTTGEYGDSPVEFVCEKIGCPRSEWDKLQSVTLLRAVLLSPYLNNDKVVDYYFGEVRKSMESKLDIIIPELDQE